MKVLFILFMLESTVHMPNLNVDVQTKSTLSICLVSLFFTNLFYYLSYFCYYLWVPLHFLVLFIGLTVLFQLTFTFIYSTFKHEQYLFYYLAYFCYYLWASLHFLVLFMNPTVLFQLTFTFIYHTFRKKFLISAK